MSPDRGPDRLSLSMSLSSSSKLKCSKMGPVLSAQEERDPEDGLKMMAGDEGECGPLSAHYQSHNPHASCHCGWH